VRVVADHLEGQVGRVLSRRQSADAVGDCQEDRRLAADEGAQRAPQSGWSRDVPVVTTAV
jgi:hypothetical protein